ncbi:MAG: hypothetical protein MJ082_05540, partial [Clostridia bacterium]|nr:hypothetical protein [Clostridia bacterium]
MKAPEQATPKNKYAGIDMMKGRDKRYIYRGLWKYLSHYNLLLTAAMALNSLAGVPAINATS